jgi:6-phosphofructokinase 1
VLHARHLDDVRLVGHVENAQAGFIPATARLADPHREMPLQIYLAESPMTMEEMADHINDQLKTDGRCIVVISEGAQFAVTQQPDESATLLDAFGHAAYGSGKTTVYQQVINYLNEAGLKTRGAARGQVPGTDQRHSMIYASVIDLDESYKVGQKAVEIAVSGENGWMATILRVPGSVYNVYYDKVPLEKVALSERTFPEKWIAPSGFDVTDDFIAYARPLIGDDFPSIPMINGLQRFTRFKSVFAKQKLNKYVPEAY